ncbi:MAG: GHKL domain-containing protein [Clostridiales bacterium]|nr:GHKL domain-containing protein [Clostridiales bacterium]
MNEIMTGYFPRIHTAIAEWLACMTFILPMTAQSAKKRKLSVAFLFLGTLLATFWLMEKERVQGVLWALVMAAAMAQMLGMICLYRWPNRPAVLYYWAHAFLLAEFTASFEWNINYYLVKYGAISTMGQTYICMAVVYALVFGAVYLFRQKRRTCVDVEGVRITKREAFSAVGIAIGAFIISNIQFAFQDTLFSESLGDGVLYARTLVDLSGVIMLYASSEQRREMLLRYELDAMGNILQRQYEQYQQFEANNEAMHRVYHDLKHQIAYLESESSAEKRSQSLREMKEIIRTHEARMNTGNRVLDVLLTSKSLICADEGITMTCYADAKLLGFMDAMDICSIFGNTLDNAIEYERTVASPEDRLIRVFVGKRESFLLIRVTNYCDHPVSFSGDTPVTTKENKKLHGYGLKSVHLCAQKYQGHSSITQEKGWFTVTVLIPLPQEQMA